MSFQDYNVSPKLLRINVSREIKLKFECLCTEISIQYHKLPKNHTDYSNKHLKMI